MELLTQKTPIMGEAALRWLSKGQRGKVLAAVSHATYLLTEQGDLVWLAGPESPRHRRCMQWPAPLPRQAVDSVFTIRGQTIELESGTKLDFYAPHVWEAPALPVGDVLATERLPDKLLAMVGSFFFTEIPVGYGEFIQPIVRIAMKKETSTGFQPGNILTTAAWPIVERIARDCLAHDLPAVLRQADELIGLGEGLTPSGDDFLGGLFFARHLLSCSYPHLFYLELSNLPEWIGAHQQCTNLISFVFLQDNAAGHALDPLNRLGIALLTNQPVARALSAAPDLIKVGHSTGWSLLTGFLVGMLLAFTD